MYLDIESLPSRRGDQIIIGLIKLIKLIKRVVIWQAYGTLSFSGVS